MGIAKCNRLETGGGTKMKSGALRTVLLVLVSVALATAGCNKAGEGKDNEAEAKESVETGNYDKYDPQMAAQAKQTARTFFVACAKEDWDTAQSLAPDYWKKPETVRLVREEYGGLEIIALGSAVKNTFKKGESKGKTYRGYYVPYKIKTKKGDIREHRLPVRNDGPGKKWRVDGEI